MGQDDEAVLARIMKLKDAMGMQDRGLERALGLRMRTIDTWKRGLSHSYMKHIPAIAEVFAVSTGYILGVKDQDVSPEIQILARKADTIPESDRKRILNLLNQTMDTFLESMK